MQFKGSLYHLAHLGQQALVTQEQLNSSKLTTKPLPYKLFNYWPAQDNHADLAFPLVV